MLNPKHLLLSRLRANGRPIVWTPDMKMGLGNFLHLWLWAYARRTEGQDAWVLHSPRMDPWLAALPAMNDLTIQRRDVRLSDQRAMVFGQAFDHEFSREQLGGFIKNLVLAPDGVGGDLQPSAADQLIVNVRRGDYYSDRTIRGDYAFDLEAYLHVAMEEAMRQGRPARIRVVSDGMDWCRARLGWLSDHTDELIFNDSGLSPVAQFSQLASTRRLIVTNSTFSYWAAYVSNVLHGDNHEQIIAPWFHSRGVLYGRAWQLDPRWNIVQTIPGGWDS